MSGRLTMLIVTFGTALTVTAPTAAQEVVLDQGDYVLQRDGEEVGVESFTLRRVGGGADAKIWATATVEMEQDAGMVEMRSVLQATADRAPLGYQNKITDGDDTEVQIGRTDRRFVAMIRSPRGERQRELRAVPGAVILEGTLAHQYYFLPEAPGSGTMEIPVIVPRNGEQLDAALSAAGTETLRIAGRTVDTRKVLLVVGGEERMVWRNDEGHVIRLEIPARGFRAERREL